VRERRESGGKCKKINKNTTCVEYGGGGGSYIFEY